MGDTYAVLVGGGRDVSESHKWFWGDLSLMYITLKEKGVPNENIFIYYADGNGNTTNEICDYCSNDFDGDLNDETIEPAFPGLIQNRIENIRSVMSEEDDFIFFFSGVGSILNPQDRLSRIWFWEGGQISDAEMFGTWFNGMTNNKTIIISSDYSGGFIDNALDNNTSIFTSTGTWNELLDDSRSRTYPEIWESNFIYSEFVYYLISAWRGIFPLDFYPPWLTNDIVGNAIFNHPFYSELNPDMNQNGETTVEEAYHYAAWQDTWSPLGEIAPLDTLINNYMGPETPAHNIFVLEGESAEWSGKRILSHDVIIEGNLSIVPGTEIVMYPFNNLLPRNEVNLFSSLTVSGSLTISSSESDVSFTSIDGLNGEFNLRPWKGINVAGGTIDLNSASIRFAETGITSSPFSSVNLNNVIIESSINGMSLNGIYGSTSIINNLQITVDEVGISQIGGSIDIINTRIIGGKTCAQLDLVEFFNLSDNTFTHSNAYGLQLFQCRSGFMTNNLIDNNGISGDHIRGGGVMLYASSPIMSGNNILHNAPTGLSSFHGSHGILNFHQYGMNSIAYNLSSEADENDTRLGVEIFLRDYSFPLLANGHNDIEDESGYLISYVGFLYNNNYDITYNYWGNESPNFDRLFYPDEMYRYVPYDPISNTTNQNALNNAAVIFEDALEQEQNENWQQAISLHQSLINLYPESLESIASIERMLFCTNEMNGDVSILQNYFDDLGINGSNPYIRRSAKNNAAQCDVATLDYTEAINRLVEIMNTSETVDDSMYALIDILLVLKYIDATVESGTSRMTALPEEIRYLQNNTEEMDKKISNIINELMRSNIENKSSYLIPLIFALHPNYPNPFNPTTTIRYDIPEQSIVSLTIYDILGREVKTLVKNATSAGFHEIRWDGKDSFGIPVSTGMYIYRITAQSKVSKNRFVKNQKMVMMK